MDRASISRLATAFALAAAAAAQAAPTAAQVTEPGRSLLRPFDVVLGGGDRDVDRTVVMLVDPNKALADAGLVDAVTRALRQNRDRMARTRLGLGLVGGKDVLVVPPTREHERVVAALQTVVRDHFPYRRFAFDQCGYAPNGADRATGLAALRAWWASVP